ncbi:MAG: DUF1565 domain-containing protein [Cyanobacteria bacterium J06638_28]
MGRRIYGSVGMVLGLAGWLGSLVPADAALPNNTARTAVPEAAIAQNIGSQSHTILYVNAAAGHDRQGRGTQMQPLKTITHALQIAQPNTLILLADGTYSEETGESFPLELSPGVTVQGAGGADSSNVTIRGGAVYLSPTQGLQNVAILGAHNAGLANVIVSNPHPSGIGLWIESGDPVILGNAFFQSGSTGIYIAGSGTPVIRNNYFAENGQAGLVIAGTSSAQVQGNIFKNTGTGISVAPGATPQIMNNQVTHNQEGLLIHAEARPVLRDNAVQQNRRNSILDYAPWTDTSVNAVVTATQPPPPSAAAIAPISAAAPTSSAATPAQATVAQPTSAATAVTTSEPPTTTVTVTEVIENPETLAVVPTSPPPSAERINGFGRDTASGLAATATALSEVDIAVNTPAIPINSTLAGLDLRPILSLSEAAIATTTAAETAEPEATVEPLAELSTSSVAVFSPGDERDTADSVVSLAAPAESSLQDNTSTPLDNELAPSENETSADPLHSENEPNAIAIPVIPPPVNTAVMPVTASDLLTPSGASDSLALADGIDDLPELPPFVVGTSTFDAARIVVPNSDIPMGSGSELPELFNADIDTAGAPPPPPSLASTLGLPYRVLVNTEDAAAEARLRERVPDAFKVRLSDQTLMQAGAYATFEEAQALAQELNQQGLRVQVEHIP